MTKARFVVLVLTGLLLFVGGASAQATASNEPRPWAISAATYTSFVPEHGDYVQPVAAVDHDLLHLEARYNYEDSRTGSVWLG